MEKPIVKIREAGVKAHVYEDGSGEIAIKSPIKNAIYVDAYYSDVGLLEDKIEEIVQEIYEHKLEIAALENALKIIKKHTSGVEFKILCDKRFKSKGQRRYSCCTLLRGHTGKHIEDLEG